MSVTTFLMLVLIAGLSGYVASQLLNTRLSLLMMIVCGFIGAYLGKLAEDYFHLPAFMPITLASGQVSVVWALAGSLLVVGVVGLLTRRWRMPRFPRSAGPAPRRFSWPWQHHPGQYRHRPH